MSIQKKPIHPSWQLRPSCLTPTFTNRKVFLIGEIIKWEEKKSQGERWNRLDTYALGIHKN
jgi:hypothetical protein